MNPKIRQNVLPILAAMIWGCAFSAQSVCSDYLGPFTVNSIRSFIAVPSLLVAILFLDRLPKTDTSAAAPDHGRGKLWFGGLCCGTILFIASNLQQFGLADTSAGKAGFITALYIVLVPLIGLFFGKRVSAAVWCSVFIAVIGLYCLCVSEAFTVAPSDLFILLCSFVFAAHILVIDHFVAQVDGVRLSCIQFLVCGILSGIFALFTESFSFSGLLRCLPQLLYLGVLSCAIAYTLQIVAQRGSNPTVVSLLLSLESVFAVLFGALLLHETMTTREWIGSALMVAAITLAQLPNPAKKEQN